MKLLRVVLALVVLGFLVLTVRAWWAEYQDASRADSGLAAPTETTPTPDPAVVAPDSSEVPPPEAPAEEAQVLVVLTDGLNFREEPDAGGSVIRGLKKDERVTIVKENDGWFQVTTEQGETGWITDNPSYSRREK